MSRIIFALGIILILILAGCTTGAEKTAKKIKATPDVPIDIEKKGFEEVICADSDNGENFEEFGIARNPSTKQEYYDTCINTNTLKEFKCDQNQVKEVSKTCEYGCSNGVCLTVRCTDSDGGENINVKGTVTEKYNDPSYFLGQHETNDKCGGRAYVIESVCTPPRLRDSVLYASDSKTIPCEGGYECKDGACVRSVTSCQDDDNGENPNVYGTVTLSLVDGTTQFERDLCLNPRTVSELSCPSGSSSEISRRDINCPDGYECDGGACVLRCTDSDGEDLLVKGTTTFYSASGSPVATYVDDCSKEYVCELGADNRYKITALDHYCPRDTPSCYDGTCAKTKYCRDSDQFEENVRKGTTEIYTDAGVLETKTDSCRDGLTVKEYFCESGAAIQISEKSFSCGTNGRCVDGICDYSRPGACPVSGESAVLETTVSYYDAERNIDTEDHRSMRLSRGESHTDSKRGIVFTVTDIRQIVSSCRVGETCSVSDERVVFTVAVPNGQTYTETKAEGETFFTFDGGDITVKVKEIAQNVGTCS